jgi:hypothetical protein
MTTYRTGDQVEFTTPATVVVASDGRIRISFAGNECDAEPSALTMVRRSIHLNDPVMHLGRRAAVTQNLEDGVFLVQYEGAKGADAYGIAPAGSLRHADDAEGGEERQAPQAPEVQVPVATAAVEPAPARADEPTPQPAVTPTAAETHAHAEPLELDTPIDYGDAPHADAAGTPSLSGMITRNPPRRAPIDLESIGRTETVPSVAQPGGEMVLGDDMRLQGGREG